MTPFIQGGDVIEPLRDRVLGRVLLKMYVVHLMMKLYFHVVR